MASRDPIELDVARALSEETDESDGSQLSPEEAEVVIEENLLDDGFADKLAVELDVAEPVDEPLILELSEEDAVFRDDNVADCDCESNAVTDELPVGDCIPDDDFDARGSALRLRLAVAEDDSVLATLGELQPEERADIDADDEKKADDENVSACVPLEHADAVFDGLKL